MLALFLLASLPAPGLALEATDAPVFADPTDDDDDEAVTFSADVAPILQENCQACHQPGSIGPMSLMSYEEVRPWGPLIQEKVSERQMPPWHIDQTVGIQSFKNDASLSEAEIQTIVQWVESGMAEGDPEDLPEPVDWPDGRDWQMPDYLGEPDLVLRSDPFTVPAQGQDLWWRPSVETGLTEERWVRAITVKPSFPVGRTVTHHVLAFLQQDQGIGGLLTEWAIGKTGEIYPEGTGKLLRPGSSVGFEVHYWPSGTEAVEDQVELGIWLYPEDYTPEYPTTLRIFYVASGNDLEIQPGELAVHQNTHLLRSPVRLESFQPHMHMRGKGMSMEATYPNGRTELLSIVSDFNWNWHTNYIYSDDAAPLLPAGTTLTFTSWHDNRPENPANPDAEQYVTWGDRTVDEMAHAWVGVTNLSEEDYERLVAEREAQQEVAESGADDE